MASGFLFYHNTVPLQVRNSIPLWRNRLHRFLCIFSQIAGTRCVPSGNRNRGETRSLISEAVVSNVKAGGFKTKTSCSFLSVTIAWPLHKGIPTMVVWKFIWPLLFADLLGIPHSMYGNSLPLDAHYSTITLWHSTKWFAFAWCNSQGKKEGPTYPLFVSSLALQNKLVSFFIIGKVLHNIINPYCKMPCIKKN